MLDKWRSTLFAYSFREAKYLAVKLPTRLGEDNQQQRQSDGWLEQNGGCGALVRRARAEHGLATAAHEERGVSKEL